MCLARAAVQLPLPARLAVVHPRPALQFRARRVVVLVEAVRAQGSQAEAAHQVGAADSAEHAAVRPAPSST